MYVMQKNQTTTFIPQMEPWFDEHEVDAITSYMKSGAWLTEFKQTRKFEDAIAEYTGVRHCVAVNNGTISLSLALLALGIKPGDEVIVPDLTMIATPNSVKLIGAHPIFVDVEPETLCMDIAGIEPAITERTKALIYVGFNGRSGDVHELKNICKNYNISFIEDAAQCLGSFYKGKHLGGFGQIGSFSFSVPKIVTTGQGGALITDDDELADKLLKLKDFGREGGGNDVHHSIGYNFKFTDLQAVIGIEQIKKLDWRVKRKKEIFKLYQDKLKRIDEIEMIPTNLEETSPWFIEIFIAEPGKLQEHLKQNNIGTRMFYPPIHKQQAYKELNNLNFPVTERFSERGLWLPSASKLLDDEIEYICDSIEEYYRKGKSL